MIQRTVRRRQMPPVIRMPPDMAAAERALHREQEAAWEEVLATRLYATSLSVARYIYQPPSLHSFPSQVRAGWSKLETARATRLEELRVAAAEAQKKMSDEQAAVRVQLEAEWAEIERQRAMQIREEHRRQVAHHTSQLEMEREQLETMREQLRKRRAAGIIQARARLAATASHSAHPARPPALSRYPRTHG